MEPIHFIVPITKKQLALLMNISNTTLRTYLNNEWYDGLKSLGYHKNSKVLSPRQLIYIEGQWGKLNFKLLNPKHSNNKHQEVTLSKND
jgi:hypothetical protein